MISIKPLAWMCSCKFAVYFQKPFYKNTSGGLLPKEDEPVQMTIYESNTDKKDLGWLISTMSQRFKRTSKHRTNSSTCPLL